MRYDKYKPTDIPWLPEMPEGWKSRKMKYLFWERSDKGHPEEPSLCSTQAYGVIPQSLYENRVVETSKSGLAFQKLVQVGDFVISLRAFQGGIEIAHYRGIISAAYTILEPYESRYAQYFKWLFKSQPFIGLLKTCVTGIREGQNINYQILSRKQIPIPPLLEQQAIVAYLGEKCGKIDEAVKAKKREVELLEEMRESVIAEAVKPKRGWETYTLANCVSLVKNKNTNMQEKNLLSLSYGNIIRKNIDEAKGLKPNSYDGYNIIERGDIVLRLTDLQNDQKSLRVGQAKERGIVTSAYVSLRPMMNYNAEFLNYVIKTFDYVKGFYNMGSGIRQSLTFNDIKQLRFAFPDFATQGNIVRTINEKCGKIDEVIKAKKREVELLEELKQSLIAETVTGQRKVA